MNFTIFAPTEFHPLIHSAIDSEFRLNEVVAIKPLNELSVETENYILVIDEKTIRIPLEWSDEIPPFLLPNPIIFNQENLLALVYLKLNNFEKAYNFAENNAFLLADIDTFNRLQHGILLTLDTEQGNFVQNSYEHYRHFHNLAIQAHYGNISQFLNFYTIKAYYETALKTATNDEFRAYTAKHMAIFLLDAGEISLAEDILNHHIKNTISDEGKFELMKIQCATWMKNLTVPYDENLLEKLKKTLWQVLEYYEKKQNLPQVGLLLIDASQIANISNSFTEALGYISRAIEIFSNEQIPELLANAQYRKGILLYTWAQNGNPQFYKPAMDAYQQALKVFKKENAPEVFAEIQHHLGVIYAEIPDEVKKKSLWAAISVSSFNQALDYFTRETFPYEFAMICNHYGNALMKFPPSVNTDNSTKALNLYRQALEIRTAHEYPHERVLTHLNFLEAAWYASHENKEQEQKLYDEMMNKALEIKQLTSEDALIKEADRHLEKLRELKGILTENI